MKDLGDATYILGIQLYRDRVRKLIDFLQCLYIEKMLKRFSMLNSKNCLFPVRLMIYLSKGISPNTPEEKTCMSKIPYASAVGSLMYTMACTRLDIAYVFNVVSRYLFDPSESH